MPVSVVVFLMLPAAHRQAAGVAELRIFGFHARGNFRNIRDNIGAQPHGVGRTGLLGVGAGWSWSVGLGVNLGVGQVEPIKQCAGQQCQPANQAHSPHLDRPSFENRLHAQQK